MRPANTTVYVAGLVGEGLLVEVELDAEGGASAAGVRLNNDLDVRKFVSLAVAAEEAGFDQLWISHDLFWRSAPVLLAAAGWQTERI